MPKTRTRPRHPPELGEGLAPATRDVPEVLSAAEAAAVLHVGLSTLYRWTAQRRIPHIVMSGRVRKSAIRYLRSDLETYLKQQRVESLPSWRAHAERWK